MIMKISKIVFYMYFIWGIATILNMCITGLEVIHRDWIPFEIINIFEIGFCVISLLESTIALVCLFIKKIDNKDKLFLIPLLFCALALWLWLWQWC